MFREASSIVLRFQCLIHSGNVTKSDGQGRISSSPSLLVEALSLYQHLFNAHSFTLSFHLVGPSISLTRIHFLHKLFVLPLHMTKPLQTFSFPPFHYITLHSICMISYVTSSIHYFSSLILSSCHTTYSSTITNFHY